MSGNKDILIPVQFGKWSNWYTIQSYIGKHKYTVTYDFRDTFMEMPFDVQFRIMSPEGMQVIQTLGPGQYIVEGEGTGSDYIRLRGLAMGFASVVVTVPAW
ncbi:colicin Z C-terminal domain-related protein [Morganella sp. EGD-HP17]|uniref:colicin Z C-terminal domain-related protein n=1 Tax=Morganella sp. EGD-HP17 TaxID=1435146 RepID=UPI000450C6EE|nr:colicin Z C-terminal domain-related protein [Morganella sp. EGD-HP17]ETO41292.1 hypothetical protein X965_10860 [Morganella sp. EGD-HP17]